MPMVYPSSKQALSCDNCGLQYKEVPSKIKRYERHFCSSTCRAEYFKGRPKKPHSEWVGSECDWCGKPLTRTLYASKRFKRSYCSKECYYRGNQGWQSTYCYRGLEETDRAKTVHFLIMHSVGACGSPGENLIVQAKQGYFTEGISDYPHPHLLLRDALFQIGHISLARLVNVGTHLNEDDWMCNGSEKWKECPILIMHDGIVTQAE